MKQQHKGRKIQNWHRPLGPQELSRWYRRHRYDPTPDDDFWHDYRGDDDFFDEDDASDLRWFELKQLLREIVHRPPPLFSLEPALEAALRGVDGLALSSAQLPQPDHLEHKLAGVVQSITHFPNHPATRDRISEAVRGGQSPLYKSAGGVVDPGGRG